MSNTENISMESSETADSRNELKSTSYYNVGSRREVLAEMRQAIGESVSIIVVSGENGVGKSAFCKMAMGKIPEDCIPVYFSRTVESFENVVRAIAQKVGSEAVDVSRAGMASTINDISECLTKQQKRVVTVFDSAEMIYLATLERIRKMLDQVNASEVLMQVVLCGRPLLLENLRQLSICNFEEVPEKRIKLEPFEASDTSAFVEFLSRHHAGPEGIAISADGIRKIHQATAGNAKKIYTGTIDILQGEDPDTVLSGIQGSTGSVKKNVISMQAEKLLAKLDHKKISARLDYKKYSSKQLGIAAGAVVSILLLMLFFGGDDPEDITDIQTPVAEQSDVKSQGKKENVQQEVAAKNTEHESAVKEAAEQPEKSAVREVTQGSPDNKAVAVETEIQKERNGEEPLAKNTSPPEQGDEALEPDAAVGPEEEPAVTNSDVAAAQQKVEESSFPETEPNQAVQETEDQTAAAIQTVEVAVAEATQGESLQVYETPEELPGGDERVVKTMSGDGEITALKPDHEVETGVGTTSEQQEVVETSIPLLRLEKKKVLIPAKPEPLEESNIVISSLSESEERKVKHLRNVDEAKKKVVPVVAPTEPIPSEMIVPERVIVEEPVELRPPPPPEEDVAAAFDTGKTKIRIPVVGDAIVPNFSVNESTVALVAVDSGSLMAERLEAGGSWLTGAKDDRYTMQLMVLGAEGAKEKVGRILSDPKYAQQAGNFYMFQRKATPHSFFVFYGEYKSMTEARNARNAIPEFLRNHRPYVLSIRGAMQKVKGS